MLPNDRLAAAQDADTSGELVNLMLFWGHKPNKDGSTGYGCFSQWWPAPFTVDGLTYPTAEHWMMAGKARLFDDADGLAAVLAATTPAAAKAAGRKVRNFDAQRWASARYNIVLAGNIAKFSQHRNLAEILLSTGDQVLVEASPRDRIWGIGMSANNSDAAHPSRWRGTNLLGFALMDTRERLGEQSAPGATT